MSERGVFAVDRGIWDHPVLQSREPFSKREAWLWMVSAATWKAKSVLVDGRRVNLGRGQLAHSIRFMAEAWRWPKSNVARFLEALKTDTMIGTASGTSLTIITICKYDEYQRVSLPDRTAVGTLNGTRVGHERDKEEDKEDKEEKEAAPKSAPPDDEADLFRRATQVLGKGSGGLVVKLLKAKKGAVPAARAAIEQASLKFNPREYVGRVIAGPEVQVMANGEPVPEGIT